MTRYAQIYSGQPVSMKSGEIFKLACCDCGLVHKVAMVSGDDDIGIALMIDNKATHKVRNHLRYRKPVLRLKRKAVRKR